MNDGDGTIDAYVQINYTGAPDAFAWIVPVPNPPKLDVANMPMLRELSVSWATSPSIRYLVPAPGTLNGDSMAYL